jgi:hypothetical protein
MAVSSLDSSARTAPIFLATPPVIIIGFAIPTRFAKDASNPFSLDIALLLRRMKAFDWPRPQRCPNCQSFRIWGHGFVYRLFDFSKKAVPMQRHRCVDCGCIIELRPEGFSPRFQAAIDTIRKSIVSMVRLGKPLKGISRQRQGHWLKALKCKFCIQIIRN